MNQGIKEAIKELARVVILAAVTAAVGWLSQKVGHLDPSSAYYVVGTLVLRLVDKYVHANPNINAKGILPL